MIDYHIHLEQGFYTLDWLIRFWHQARNRGLQEIGITEHTHRFEEFRPVYEHLWTDSRCDPVVAAWMGKEFKYSLEDYFKLLDEGRRVGIPLKIGLEADYFPRSEERLRSLLKTCNLDYVIGSVHFLDHWAFDYDPKVWTGRNVDEAYLDYITMVEKMVRSGLFDILGHLDVLKVFGARPTKNLDMQWKALLNSILQADLVIEVSTAGLRKSVGEIYPHPDILREACGLGIPITVSSDAHTPLDVGDRWEQAVRLAISVGYRRYSSFTKRNRTDHKLPPL